MNLEYLPVLVVELERNEVAFALGNQLSDFFTGN
jgi:hypothetical protein